MVTPTWWTGGLAVYQPFRVVPLLLWSQGSSPKCLSIGVKPFRTARNSFFRTCSFSFWHDTWHEEMKATGMSFSCRCGLFGIWWGETCCAPNSLELESRLCQLGQDLTTVPAREYRTTFRFFRNWVLFDFFVVSFFPESACEGFFVKKQPLY